MKTQLLHLPIDDFIPEAKTLLTKNQNLIISAAPGAGKTTRIPPAFLSLTDKQIWVLEPRRMAAVAAAHRISEEQHWTLGEEVGYQVRFETKASARSRVIFLTEALLARKFLQDPELSDCGIVILDEFHERSLQVDLALGLLKETQMLGRPDLKIVVMSATLNQEPLLRYLESPAKLNVPGRLYPIELHYAKSAQLLRTDFHFIDRVFKTISEHIQGRPQGRDVLVFLPGQSEIFRLQKRIEESPIAALTMVFPLMGSLSLDEQLMALQPAKKRKIILSTNVAESSVTIDGIDTVIDTGLHRSVSLHPQTGFERIELKRISKASAHQRAGRAARQFPGTCLRLWTKADELSMPDFEIGEIHRRDLSEVVLLLYKLGITKPSEFSWYEAPDPQKLNQAQEFLLALGGIDDKGLTSLGTKLASLPLSPRLGKLLILSAAAGESELGSEIAALLQERDILTQSTGTHDWGCDLCERLEALPRLHSLAAKTVRQAAQQLKNLIPQNQNSRKHGDLNRQLIADLLLECYPDRICRRRSLLATDHLSCQMIGGKGVTLQPTSSANKSEFFIALEIMETGTNSDSQVKLASTVSKEQIFAHYQKQIKVVSQIRFDEERKAYFFDEWQDLMGLRLEEVRKRPAKVEEISHLLPQILTARFDFILTQNNALRSWWSRWLYFEQQNSFVPLFTPDNLLKVFTEAAFNENNFNAVIEKDLTYYFESKIDVSMLEQFHRLCPAKLQVPSGSSIPIHYHLDKTPHLEVRLQELFGLLDTPKIFSGKINLSLHLLAPNYRPVQVTSDLASFWDNTYEEVKKELRFRYPKHSWPDNPRTAPAQAKGRPRQS